MASEEYERREQERYHERQMLEAKTTQKKYQWIAASVSLGIACIFSIVFTSLYFYHLTCRSAFENGYVQCMLPGSQSYHWCKSPENK